MYARRQGITHWMAAGLLLSSIGCSDGDEKDEVKPSEPAVPVGTAQAGLSRASDCTDLLTKIQNDAIAKLKMVVEREKAQAAIRIASGDTGMDLPNGPRDAGLAGPILAPGMPGRGDSAGVPTTGGMTPSPSAPPQSESDSSGDDGASVPGPVGASDTNSQVAGVDEADFVKVVESGRGIFLLHGSTLQKLKSWPAAETALVGKPLAIEGSPSEMFVTDEGKAVIFSSVYEYGGSSPPVFPGGDVAIDCNPMYCGKGGAAKLKITVADVTGTEPRVERELYYEGSYVSSRRYDSGASDVVRAIIQASSKFSGLYQPEVDWLDPWGRAYDQANIATQLDEWAARTTASIRKTTLDEWLPVAQERKGVELVAIAPQCDSYFVPEAGLSDYGLTHVLSLDVASPTAPIGGVTIVGASSTVYSSAERLVLAQPDYRWLGPVGDFGLSNGQQTALHLFNLAGAGTTYVASGLVPGHLPLRNPQFGIDVAGDTIRVATTGFVRNDPEAERDEPAFWQQHTENQVVTARADGSKLVVTGKSENLGHERESVYAARFVGDRAYIVTFLQTDPLIVVDVSQPTAPKVLGEIEIPGFSEYMHPLDANHLLTAGQSASRGIQLQIFDVTDPRNIPKPKVLDFGGGSSSDVSYDHKAFTFFEGVLAMPVQSYGFGFRAAYRSALEVVRVDASTGFQHLGTIDHGPLYADNGAGVSCGRCDMTGCFDYVCGYAPQVRRGHFVKSDSSTYVYSFSHAGVLVNDLASIATPVARVGLPAPMTYYGGGGVPTTDAGVARPPVALDGGSAMPVPSPMPERAPDSAADAGVDLGG